VRREAILFLFLLGIGACAVKAQATFPLETGEFAKNASDVTTVSLDRNMLLIGKYFTSGAAEQIINRLDGIYIRDYKFNGRGKYSRADVESMRKQLQGKGWTPIVTARRKDWGKNADIYFHENNGQVDGMFVMDTKPRELAFCQIRGPIKPEDLGALWGKGRKHRLPCGL
jgi:hypothetical protein